MTGREYSLYTLGFIIGMITGWLVGFLVASR